MLKKILLFVMFPFGMIHAQDRIFTYTYQSQVLNKSQKEIEVWTTLYNGRNKFYRGLQHRLEFEIGLGKKLQTAFYLNYGYAKGITTNNGSESLFNDNSYSFSNEWKYKISDPVGNTIGSGLYFEYALGPSETELEWKIILDKQIGRSIHAFNIVGEYEFEKEFEAVGNEIDAETEHEPSMEFNYAFAYKIKDGLFLGFEAFNQNQFSSEGELESSVLSLGPCISYYTSDFWINLTFMPQITNLKGGGLELNNHEKLQTRLIFSYAF